MCGIWGWLNPLRDKLDANELTDNEHIFSYEGHKGFKILWSVDKVQLEGIGRVYVNNQTEVAPGKKITLTHNDRIATKKTEPYDYVFLNKSTSDVINKDYPDHVSNKYLVSYLLGKGGFGEVYLVFERNTNKRFAMKVIKKTENGIYFDSELKIMKELRHPCCVRIEQALDGVGIHYVILEHMAGGDLKTYIAENKQLQEPSAKLIFYQLTVAIEYLHKCRIVHRDIKPRNILLASKSPETLIKVTDFGVSKYLNKNTPLISEVGTSKYWAPELHQLHMKKTKIPYTHKVDVWSMGILLFYCLTSKLPFSNVLDIAKPNYVLDASVYLEIPDEAASLLKKMLMTKPEDRTDVKNILNDAWLQDEDMKTKANHLMKGEEVVEFAGVVFIKKILGEDKGVAYMIGLDDDESWLMGNMGFVYNSDTT